MRAVDDSLLTDDELAARARTGDDEALAALYERYAAGIYDFALHVVRDPNAAAEVVEATFLEAQGAPKSEAVGARAWLLGLARDDALAETGRRAPEDRGADGLFPVPLDLDPRRPGAVADKELVHLTWATAAALPAHDYALLDLHLRQQLDTDELASIAGAKVDDVGARLAELRESLVTAVAAVLLLRRARRECAELGARLVELGATRVTPEVRLAVEDHLRTCERCAGIGAVYAAADEVLAALAPVVMSPSLEADVRRRIFGGEGAPRTGRSRRGRKIPRAVAIGVIVAALATASAGGSYLAFRGPGVSDPSNIASFTHEVDQATSDGLIGVEWAPVQDATGYSVSWSREPELPDQTRDLAGTAERTTFRASPGRWWFNLRTQGRNGRWTSTVHLGPFVVLPVPDTRVVASPGHLTNDPTPTFKFSATQPSTFECSVDGAPFKECPPHVTFSSFDDGEHKLEVRARDRFDNADVTPLVYELRIDTTGPRVVFTAVGLDDDRATFAFRGKEKRVTYECLLNDEGWDDCKSPVHLNGLEEGEQHFRVRARDRAGNRGPAARRTWKVDTVPPTTRITAGPSGGVESSSATFAFRSSEPESDFECSLDGAAFVACSSPVTFRGLEVGRHTFRVSARDSAGNSDESPSKRAWTVQRDTIPPNTTITSGPASVTGRSRARFTFTSEADATFECRFDGGAWKACSSPRTYTGVAAGAHRFLVRAVDTAGNRDATPARWDWVRSG